MQDARTTSRKALALLDAMSCEPTPRAYALAYALASAPDGPIASEVASSVTRAGRLRPSDVDRIHDALVDTSRATFVDTADRLDRHLGETLELVGAGAERSGIAARRLAAAGDRTQAGAVLREAAEDQGELMRRLQDKSDELDAMRRRYQESLEEARRDPLTGLANRRAYDERLSEAVDGAGPGRPLSMLIADIDHFKAVNDAYGHSVGDEVIRLVGKTIRAAIRTSDLAARIGGEEFAVVLPGADGAAAVEVAERIREAIARYRRLAAPPGEALGRKITVSIGVAEAGPGETGPSLYARADACLYAAKRSGRNRVVDGLSRDALPEPGQPAP